MADKYTEFVSRGFGRDLAKKLGLPQPAVLRRYTPGQPLLEGPVVVLGRGSGADGVASELLGWGLDVRRSVGGSEKLAALVLVLDGLTHPSDLSAPVLEAGQLLRQLRPSARVVTLSRAPRTASDPATSAARRAVDGFVRSLAKELRAGATANGLVLEEDVPADSPAALGALRFFLSARSAFVDGQFLEITDSPAVPDGGERPLEGRVAVVTGAARGIGAAIATTLSRDGARTILVDVPAAGEQLAQVANRVGGIALQADITAPDAAAKILALAEERFGRLDIVVHNAGITRDKLLANMDPGRWESVIAVNIASQLRMNEEFLASELFSDRPRIVSLASTSGIAGNRGQTNYGASKAAVIGMVQATAASMARLGGTINAVAPGFIETEMTARIPFATREVARRLNSLQQGGQPGDVAEAIAFLASDAAGGVNGEVLRVCGQNLVGA
ncbi:3-oxoacyl-ACP reductase [Arthrobacter woluwensis]|uniref:3-oxoacyl-ACP reductase n=1 Tax=Arthrobacter woluwensis TaxID=156980 RepID=UPI000D132049|nr:3-oxoacyl-ACP reductase [Arthrobacter woluwensis]PSS45338.1 3-oxoacyl-ACP reductase [Arthrobacter woluwensis]